MTASLTPRHSFLPASTPPEHYVGLPKGKKQVLWERSLWKDGMVEKVDEAHCDDAKGRDQVRAFALVRR